MRTFRLGSINPDDEINIYVGFSSFVNNLSYQNPNFKMLDTLRINDVLYYDVFEFDYNWCDDTNKYENCTQKLFYNFDYGILKVDQSFNEFYEIHQD